MFERHGVNTRTQARASAQVLENNVCTDGSLEKALLRRALARQVTLFFGPLARSVTLLLARSMLGSFPMHASALSPTNPLAVRRVGPLRARPCLHALCLTPGGARTQGRTLRRDTLRCGTTQCLRKDVRKAGRRFARRVNVAGPLAAEARREQSGRLREYSEYSLAEAVSTHSIVWPAA